MFRLVFFFSIVFSSCCFSQKQDSTRTRLVKEVNASNPDSLKLDALLALGEYELDHNFSKAREVINKAFLLVKEKESTLGASRKALVHVQMGVLDRRLGRHSEALEHYLKALKLFKSGGDEKNEADVYHNIGMVYVFQKKHVKSREYFNRSIDLNERLHNDFGVAQATQMLGTSYNGKKTLDSALLCFTEAKQIFGRLGANEQLQEVNNNLVSVHRRQKDYESALKLSLQNIDYSKEKGKQLALCGNYYATALVYERLEEYRMAGKYVDSSLKVAKKEGFVHRIANAYRKRAQMWNKLENHGAAYRDFKRYKKYSDSIFNAETAAKIQELELLYEFERKQQEIDLITKSERAKKQLYFALFIITLIGAGVIALLVRRNYRNKIEITLMKHKSEKELLGQEIKNKETNVKQLIADNTMRLTFKREMLDRIKTDSNAENAVRMLKDLTNDLRLQIESEGKLSGLQDKINTVNQDFDNALKMDCPELTKGEREVVALLRLKLSIKEIMTIRNVSEDSVKSMRRRIRKKMGIPKAQSIEDFIQTLV